MPKLRRVRHKRKPTQHTPHIRSGAPSKGINHKHFPHAAVALPQTKADAADVPPTNAPR